MRVGLLLIENALTPLAKNFFIPLKLKLTAALSARHAAIQKKIYESDINTLIISNKEMKVIMKIVKPLKESNLWTEGVSKIIENEAKKSWVSWHDIRYIR